jgi:hypothetical protein
MSPTNPGNTGINPENLQANLSIPHDIRVERAASLFPHSSCISEEATQAIRDKWLQAQAYLYANKLAIKPIINVKRGVQ